MIVPYTPENPLSGNRYSGVAKHTEIDCLKFLITALVILFVLLQWRLWFGDGGVRQVSHASAEARALSQELARQQDVNTALRAEVADLADGVGEIEERARSELGMIGEAETFYQFVGEKKEAPGDNLAQTAMPIDKAE